MPAWTGALIALVGLALMAWVLSSISHIHSQLATISPTLATAVLAALMLALLAILIVGVRFMWVASRTGRKTEAVASTDPTEAAGQSVDAARKQIDLVVDEVARRALTTELEEIEGDLAAKRYTVVVFGTGSAGKTSVINALLGHEAGATDPAVGTTKAGVEHAYTIDGFDDGKLRLVDTPGLSEIGEGGMFREERARELAAEADLLLFVVDQDLRDIEFKPLSSLAKLGKRSILLFNKQDLFSDQDADAIAQRLRTRVDGLIAPADVVVCAANPVAVTVREASGDESAETPPPDVSLLADRLADTLHAEGRDLLAGNVLLRAKRISEKARDRINEARRQAASSIVTRFQWTTAGVMFVNPVPGLGALATAAINYQMIAEIAKVFGLSISIDDAKRLATELGQLLVKMGVVSLATNILGKALKASIAGFVAGGAIEAVAGAYLTKLSGEAFIDYFSHDQDWGEGGMQGAVERRFQLEGKTEFIAGFIKEATRRVLDRREGDSQ